MKLLCTLSLCLFILTLYSQNISVHQGLFSSKYYADGNLITVDSINNIVMKDIEVFNLWTQAKSKAQISSITSIFSSATLIGSVLSDKPETKLIFAGATIVGSIWSLVSGLSSNKLYNESIQLWNRKQTGTYITPSNHGLGIVFNF